MRYCPNCKKEVKTSLTGGQTFLAIFLILFLFPIGLLYALFHSRKCPSCGASTSKHEPRN